MLSYCVVRWCSLLKRQTSSQCTARMREKTNKDISPDLDGLEPPNFERGDWEAMQEVLEEDTDSDVALVLEEQDFLQAVLEDPAIPQQLPDAPEPQVILEHPSRELVTSCLFENQETRIVFRLRVFDVFASES